MGDRRKSNAKKAGQHKAADPRPDPIPDNPDQALGILAEVSLANHDVVYLYHWSPGWWRRPNKDHVTEWRKANNKGLTYAGELKPKKGRWIGATIRRGLTNIANVVQVRAENETEEEYEDRMEVEGEEFAHPSHVFDSGMFEFASTFYDQDIPRPEDVTQERKMHEKREKIRTRPEYREDVEYVLRKLKDVDVPQKLRKRMKRVARSLAAFLLDPPENAEVGQADKGPIQEDPRAARLKRREEKQQQIAKNKAQNDEPAVEPLDEVDSDDQDQGRTKEHEADEPPVPTNTRLGPQGERPKRGGRKWRPKDVSRSGEKRDGDTGDSSQSLEENLRGKSDIHRAGSASNDPEQAGSRSLGANTGASVTEPEENAASVVDDNDDDDGLDPRDSSPHPPQNSEGNSSLGLYVSSEDEDRRRPDATRTTTQGGTSVQNQEAARRKSRQKHTSAADNTPRKPDTPAHHGDGDPRSQKQHVTDVSLQRNYGRLGNKVKTVLEDANTEERLAILQEVQHKLGDSANTSHNSTSRSNPRPAGTPGPQSGASGGVTRLSGEGAPPRATRPKTGRGENQKIPSHNTNHQHRIPAFNPRPGTFSGQENGQRPNQAGINVGKDGSAPRVTKSATRPASGRGLSSAPVRRDNDDTRQGFTPINRAVERSSTLRRESTPASPVPPRATTAPNRGGRASVSGAQRRTSADPQGNSRKRRADDRDEENARKKRRGPPAVIDISSGEEESESESESEDDVST